MTGAGAALLGDEAGFATLAERHRRELHVHCYRMLASFDEAEDAVQETLLRAWRGRDGFDGSSLVRAWLYRIATNVCLDLLRRRSRRLTAIPSFAEVPWLQPYPDRLLDEVAPSDDQPDAVAVDRETIELTFLAAMQVLPPRQRAALILRDVLGWPAADTAALLETSVAAANSALQRARATMQAHLPARRSEWSAGGADRPRSGPCWSASSTPTSGATRRPRSPSPRRTSGSPCRPPPTASRDWPWSPPSSSGPSPRRPATATGAWCRPRPTACPPPPATCAGRATPSSGPSSSTSCASTDGVIAEITTFGPAHFADFGLPPTL